MKKQTTKSWSEVKKIYSEREKVPNLKIGKNWGDPAPSKPKPGVEETDAKSPTTTPEKDTKKYPWQVHGGTPKPKTATKPKKEPSNSSALKSLKADRPALSKSTVQMIVKKNKKRQTIRKLQSEMKAKAKK